MKAKTWRLAGLVMALMGAMTMANAGQGQRGGAGDGQGHGKEGKKGPDGRPSREEMLKKYDKDGDGQLNEQERAALRADMEKRQGKRDGERPSREEMLEKFDTDGDGQLSEAERKAMRKSFESRQREREQQGE